MTEYFRCRTVRPTVTPWRDIEAEDYTDAVIEYHYRMTPDREGRGLGYNFSPGNTVYFARVECEGHGELIARTFWKGIVRAGGVKPAHIRTLRDIADAVGWEDDPEGLIADGWDREESEWQ